MYKILISILICLLAINGIAQDDPLLKQQLHNKRTLKDIMEVVENYYKNPATLQRMGTKDVNRNYKHWQRWALYWSSRTAADGSLVNVTQKQIEATGLSKKNWTTAKGQSVNGTWGLIGPNVVTSGIGRVDRVACHPTNANIIYAGAAGGGLWRTSDAGGTWTNLTADLPALGISGICIDPTNTNNLFILTGDGDSDIGGLVDDFGYMRFSIGVLRSTDGGNNWFKTGAFPGTTSTLVGYRLTMHPTNSAILFACTNQGLFRSDNSGSTWALVQGDGRFINMVFRPNSSFTCYATARSISGASRSYFWRSTDGGINWDSSAIINNQINTPTTRVELAVAPTNSNLVYLLCGASVDSSKYKGLFRSTDAGVSFSLQSNSPNIVGDGSDGISYRNQSTYDLALAVSNTSSATVTMAAIQSWRSTNSGVTWSYGGGLHDDVHDLAYHPAGNKLWAGSDGGVYSSTDNGATWTPHLNGMSISQIYRMAVSPVDYNAMMCGLQDNGVKQRSGETAAFESIGGADGYCVGYDVGDPSVYFSINNTSLVRYTNNGGVAKGVTPFNVGLGFFSNMAMHTTIGDRVLIASDTFRVVTNNGTTWSKLVSSNMPLGGWYLRTCPSNGNRVYMAGGSSYQSSAGVLRRSDDGGTSWPNNLIISNGDSFPVNFPKITCINVDPTNSLRVWITFGNYRAGTKVYYSGDGGVNWVNRSGNLPNLPVNCVAVDNGNNAYIGTDNGIYYWANGSNNWVPFYNNLPYVPVTDLIISQTDNRIRAATYGRGIWSSDLYSPCLPNLTISGTLEGQEFYEAGSTINSTATVKGSTGTDVRMRAGMQLDLTPGFQVLPEGKYQASIGPCGSGGVVLFSKAITDSSKLVLREWYKPTDRLNCMIETTSLSGNQLQARLNVQQGGMVQVVVTDAAGNIIYRTEPESFAKGIYEKTYNLNMGKPGMYYVQVIHNNRWEHFQELERK